MTRASCLAERQRLRGWLAEIWSKGLLQLQGKKQAVFEGTVGRDVEALRNWQKMTCASSLN